MAEQPKVGAAVVAQAEDNSLENTNPVAWRGALGSIVALLLMIAVYQGWITQDSSNVVSENIDKIIDAILVILPIAIALWARLKAYAPKTAAKIAVANASAISSVPTLVTPP